MAEVIRNVPILSSEGKSESSKMENVNSQNLAIDWGVAQSSYKGLVESGDACFVAPSETGYLLAVIDGLGHGSKAAVAATQAVEALQARQNMPLATLMEDVHRELRSTRGAAITMVTIDSASQTLSWIGVGNVSAVLVRANESSNREHLLLRGGVVGYRLPTLRVFKQPLNPGDTLVLATDGLRSGFASDISLDQPVQAVADEIHDRYKRETDDSLVLVIRMLVAS